MKRRQFLSSGAALLVIGSAAPALAQTAQDQVIELLRAQGYRRIRVRRTLLGRVRITATGPAGRREIVLNPSTGAILRDYIDRDDDDDDPFSGDNDGSSEDSRDYSGDDDDNDDRGDDDDGDDDNSGSGNSNSGSGSDNSGSGGGGDDGGDDGDDD